MLRRGVGSILRELYTLVHLLALRRASLRALILEAGLTAAAAEATRLRLGDRRLGRYCCRLLEAEPRRGDIDRRQIGNRGNVRCECPSLLGFLALLLGLGAARGFQAVGSSGGRHVRVVFVQAEKGRIPLHSPLPPPPAAPLLAAADRWARVR
eukprot:1735740-Prymnesium_polylepis.3